MASALLGALRFATGAAVDLSSDGAPRAMAFVMAGFATVSTVVERRRFRARGAEWAVAGGSEYFLIKVDCDFNSLLAGSS